MRQISARSWALAILSGILQVLPFPIAGPTPLWRTAFCWVALAPLLWVLMRRDATGSPLRMRDGAALGYAAGFVWYLGSCYWIYATMHIYGGLSKPVAAGILVLFCLYLGLYHALFGAVIAALRRALGAPGALLLSPFAWVAVELARARITCFPWDLLGVAQVDNLLLTRVAPYTGAYGLSFVIAAVNALWLVRIELKERKYTRTTLTLAGVVIVVAYVVFLRTLPAPNETNTRMPYSTATLLQENLEVGAEDIGPQLSKEEMLRRFSELSVSPPYGGDCDGIPELPGTACRGYLTALRPPPNPDGTPAVRATDLIVWPESPAPFEETDPKFREAMSQLAMKTHAPIIAGNIGIDADKSAKRGYDLFNSADFIDPDGRFVGRYDKIHLVPFGEYVPFKKLFFFAGSLLQDVGTFDPGWRRSLFDVGGHKYGTFICYEAVFGDEVREYAKSGAEVLVNISNDGWYGDTSAAWQHLNMVRLRAIENHRWVLRATNTGVTASIDPYGRVVRAARRHVRMSIQVYFNYEHGLTFYARHGDWFAYFCAMVTLAGFGFALARYGDSSLRPE